LFELRSRTGRLDELALRFEGHLEAARRDGSIEHTSTMERATHSVGENVDELPPIELLRIVQHLGPRAELLGAPHSEGSAASIDAYCANLSFLESYYLPEHPVSVGQSWPGPAYSIRYPGAELGDPLLLRSTHTLRQLSDDGRIAIVDAELVGETVGGEPRYPMRIRMHGTAHYKHDLTAGVTVKADIRLSSHIARVVGDGIEAGSTEATTTAQYTAIQNSDTATTDSAPPLAPIPEPPPPPPECQDRISRMAARLDAGPRGMVALWTWPLLPTINARSHIHRFDERGQTPQLDETTDERSLAKLVGTPRVVVTLPTDTPVEKVLDTIGHEAPHQRTIVFAVRDASVPALPLPELLRQSHPELESDSSARGVYQVMNEFMGVCLPAIEALSGIAFMDPALKDRAMLTAMESAARECGCDAIPLDALEWLMWRGFAGTELHALDVILAPSSDAKARRLMLPSNASIGELIQQVSAMPQVPLKVVLSPATAH